MNEQLTLARAAQPPLDRHIPPWVLRRLQHAIDSGVHYEASLYGPYNTFLTALFPMERHFMVKPQGLLRREFNGRIPSDKGSIASEDVGEITTNEDVYRKVTRWMEDVPDEQEEEEDEEEEEAGEVNGALARAVQKKGTSGSPDFVVVKASEGLVDDTIVAIIEVKADDDLKTLRQAEIQIMNYLGLAATKKRAANLKGYLLMAKTVHVWGFNSPAHDATYGPLTSYAMNLDRLKQELYIIAGAHWDIA
ncbi:hypothetical protein LshimejAT787_0601060 [Lyophyllum shimeji]|uniref:Uncharacterized protein n=1 Tax=Lyophyllum shimeji TaxID=47721 RepID=A0A9P3PP02_LYOSH|nr:hypothetical protein LshimejAT787_0601060 [Lyophyllum shimeji]